ncbi:ArsR/SmtB family transcription factor [Halospeciosus flavus]|uniref:ArsR/SmtB family transcription factor n=1 Tax=Halospeciosus flavus TaxID=3032283 RepID=A0ABD5Z043_9EURY
MTEESDPSEIFATLDDEYARDILVATKTDRLSAKELSEECDMSRPTVSRRVTRLVEQGLLERRVYARRPRRTALQRVRGSSRTY